MRFFVEEGFWIAGILSIVIAAYCVDKYLYSRFKKVES